MLVFHDDLVNKLTIWEWRLPNNNYKTPLYELNYKDHIKIVELR